MKRRFRRRFRLLVAAQAVALALTTALLAYTAVATDFVAVTIVIGLVVLLQVTTLVRYVESHVDDLEDFFATVRYEDFTRRFVEEGVDAELKEAFNAVIRRFREARADREVQAEYLETVVRHVPVPLLAVRADGSLRLANNPLRRLTGMPDLRHVDDLGRLDERLPRMLADVPAGRQRLLQARFRDVPVELRVSVSELRLDGSNERIYSIENLSGELTARESSAWRNLIRVLTHEIMNTLTPVTSLAQSCGALVDDADRVGELRDALATIARRSEGLTNFVARYRELLQVPQPATQPVGVEAALESIVALMRRELDGVDVTVAVTPATLKVDADPALLDQVLLNLVRNAVQAMAGRSGARLTLGGRLDYGRALIQVADNGPGIPEELRDQVFIPFFTTRRGGSGIGLSVSRQIMTAHGGELTMASGPDGTVMTLLF